MNAKSITKFLIETLPAALAFSLFIYLEEMGVANRAITAAAGVYALYRLLQFSPKAMAASGFFIGLLWFYWIGLSFRYVEMAWAVLPVMIGVASVIALLFWVLGWVRPVWARAAVMLLYFDWVTPFGFAWLKPELLFVNSFLGTAKWQMALILAVIVAFIYLKERSRYAPVLFILLLPAWNPVPPTEPLEKGIVLSGTDYTQEQKWNPANTPFIVDTQLERIAQAAEAGNRLIILPESVFPLYLNYYPDLIHELKVLSRKITIVTGGLYRDTTGHYNSTYFFDNGEMTVAHKVVLVPFGETTDFLPERLGKMVNAIFFESAEDYTTAVKPTDFMIGGEKWRSAICYEATVERMYADAPGKMIAISNNAWYKPSTEPALQRVLIRYFSRKYGVRVYHVVNGSPSEVIGN